MTYHYIVGGTLFSDADSYVTRQVDWELYESLMMGKFCYVLNSRQTGKSSLRVQMENRLTKIGTSCGVFDFSVRDTKSQPDQWYADTFYELATQFNLGVNLSWWAEHKALSPVTRLSIFIEEVLLVEVPGKIVLFIDEIDSVLSLPFQVNDFFALIRACYNRRANTPAYNRLTFALFGVATPSDLIQDKYSTPFNIGEAIHLTGFQFEEARPLARGLTHRVSDPEAVLKQVLEWTNGQPFLTQQLCALIQTSQDFIPEGDEAERVETLVQSHIIQNWEFQDEKGHLSHIRDRILADEQQACFLLGLYQQILQQHDVGANHSPEQMKLCLSGLVVERDDRLSIYNRIYQEVFNLDWVAKELVKKRRLYGEALEKWFISNCQDESWLLDERTYLDATEWAKDRHLSNQDQQFLAASANKLNRQKIKRLTQRLTRRFSYLVLLSVLVVSLLFIGSRWQEAKQQTEQLKTEQLVNQAQSERNPRISALLALEAMQQFKHQKRFSPNAAQILYYQLDVLPRLLKTVEHLEDVETISFSHTGQHLISTSLDGTAKRWDVASGKISHLKDIGKANVTAFSSDEDGKMSAIAQSNILEIRDTKSWKLIRRFELSAYITAISFSPDCKLIAIATVNKTRLNQSNRNQVTAEIREIASGNRIASLNRGNSVNSLAFSPDGILIVTASADGTAQVWNTVSGRPIAPLMKHNGAILDAAFSTDGKFIATASLDKTAVIWEVRSARPFRTFPHEQEVTDVSLSHDRKWIATASKDRVMRVWDMTNPNPNLIAYIPHKDFVTAVAFNPSRKNEVMIATASLDNKARLWKIKDNAILTRLTHNGDVTSVAFSPQGDQIITASLAQSTNPASNQTTKHTLHVWQTTDHQQKKINQQTEFKSAIATNGTTRISEESSTISPDGQLSAISSSDSIQSKTTIQFWQNRSGHSVQMEIDQKGVNQFITFSQNNHFLATASDDNIVRVWKVPTQDQFTSSLTRLKGNDLAQQFPSESPVQEIALSPDGSQLVVAATDNTATLWNVGTQQPVANWNHDSKINAVTFSSQGSWIATASDDNQAKVFDKVGSQHCEALQNDGGVTAIAFSHNEQYLAIGSLDSKGRIWNLKQCQNEIPVVLNHLAQVNAIAFSSDDQFVATASEDKTARVWTRSKGEEVVRLDHANPVNAVAFSPQRDRLIATISSDKTVNIWSWQFDDLHRQACKYITETLTQKEWRRYIHNENYRAICS